MKIICLGRGAWGRGLCAVAQRLGHEVFFVSHEVTTWGDVGADYLIISLPVQHIRETLAHLPAPGVPVLSLSKGLEIQTGYRVSQIITEVWGEERVAALSGPTFAAEVAANCPAVCTLAARDEALATEFLNLLHQPNFRVYRSTDIIGVELGGALKNVYAIAGGTCHGLKLGQNTLAGLITRCLAEMMRIGISLGAKAETFYGLSGMGDLILTATSEQSRNFRLGALLAQGLTVEQILPKLGGVCEGLTTTRSLALNANISEESKPIITQIHKVLYEGLSPSEAVRLLLGRAARDE